MDALKACALVLALVIATPAQADPVSRWRPYVEEASARFGIPVAWVERVMRAESGGRTMRAGAPITSSAGAMGLMQLMPATWHAMRTRLALAADPYDPHANILAGTAYLRLMYDRFGYPGLFAAYNAGPTRYADHIATGRALPAETRAYVATVMGSMTVPVQNRLPQPENPLFVALNSGPSSEHNERSHIATTDLFVPLSHR